MDILTFDLDGQRYAFPADRVVQVVQMVAISALPGAPAVVEGVVNVRGTIVPVFDIRSRLGLSARPVDAGQHLIILSGSSRQAAVRVDAAQDFVSIPDEDVTGSRSLADSGVGASGTRHIAGVAATAEGTTVIYDLSAFLSLSESNALEEALTSTGG